VTWRADSSSVSSASLRHHRDLLRIGSWPRRPAAPAHGGVGQRAGHGLLQHVHLVAVGLHERADLRRGLRGETLLETLQRGDAVAVAVVIAALARGAQRLGLLLLGAERRLGGSRCGLFLARERTR
jgi:hypothetical protein